MKSATLTLVAGAAVAAFSGSGLAGPAPFFGFDANNSDTVPLTLLQRPNSLAASAAFLGAILFDAGDPQQVGFEASEGFTANTFFPAQGATGVNPGGSFAPFGASPPVTFTTTNSVVRFQAAGTAGPPGAPEGRYPSSGEQYLSASTSNLGIQFNQPVTAFGFWGIDVGDFGGHLSLNLANGGLMTFQVNHPVGSNGSTSGSILFWGIIVPAANAFTGVSFTNSAGAADVFAFDDFTVALPVQTGCTPGDPNCPIPLPSGFGLGLAGVIGLGGLRLGARRRA